MDERKRGKSSNDKAASTVSAGAVVTKVFPRRKGSLHHVRVRARNLALQFSTEAE